MEGIKIDMTGARGYDEVFVTRTLCAMEEGGGMKVGEE